MHDLACAQPLIENADPAALIGDKATVSALWRARRPLDTYPEYSSQRPLPSAHYAWPVLVGNLTLPDPVPDCSDIPKGPSRHLEIIGCDFAHIFLGATTMRQQQTGSVSHAAG
jgi:hypothetical protein